MIPSSLFGTNTSVQLSPPPIIIEGAGVGGYCLTTALMMNIRRINKRVPHLS